MSLFKTLLFGALIGICLADYFPLFKNFVAEGKERFSSIPHPDQAKDIMRDCAVYFANDWYDPNQDIPKMRTDLTPAITDKLGLSTTVLASYTSWPNNVVKVAKPDEDTVVQAEIYSDIASGKIVYMRTTKPNEAVPFTPADVSWYWYTRAVYEKDTSKLATADKYHTLKNLMFYRPQYGRNYLLLKEIWQAKKGKNLPRDSDTLILDVATDEAMAILALPEAQNIEDLLTNHNVAMGRKSLFDDLGYLVLGVLASQMAGWVSQEYLYKQESPWTDVRSVSSDQDFR